MALDPTIEPASSTAVQGRPAFAGRASQTLLQTKPRFASVLVHHPGQYELDMHGAVPMVLPSFVSRPLQPGVSGIRAARQSDKSVEDAWKTARSDDESLGAMWISPLKFGYHVAYDCQDPKTRVRGVCKLYRWQTPVTIPGQGVKFETDFVARREFYAELMATGVVPAPLPEHLEPLLRDAQARVDRTENDPQIPASLREKMVAEARARLAATEYAIGVATGEIDPDASAKAEAEADAKAKVTKAKAGAK